MSNFLQKIIIFAGFALLCGAAYFAYIIWRSAEDGAYLSCTSSIAEEISKLDKTSSLLAQSNNWKILTEAEVIALMSQIYGHDCGKYSDQTVDLWNRRINIALRKPAKKIDIFVWSSGADGVSGTIDDLVIPYGERPPK